MTSKVLWMILCGCLIKVYSFLENVALNKPTSQITTSQDRVSSRAVDGNTNTAIEFCSHTLGSPPGVPLWWMVDLSARYQINNIKILNRSDKWYYRLSNFLLTVWEIDPGSYIKDNSEVDYCTCAHYPGIAPRYGLTDIPCTKICTGRFVVVILKGSDILTLCQLEVYGQLLSNERKAARYWSTKERQVTVGSSVELILSTASLSHCSLYCLQHDRCLSFNYRSTGGADNCILITSSVHPLDDLSVNSSWTWSSMIQIDY